MVRRRTPILAVKRRSWYKMRTGAPPEKSVFIPETQVLTPKGPAKAGALMGGATIFGFAGPARPTILPVARLFVRSHRAPVVRVITEQGYRVTVTPDHLFFVQLKPARVYY